MSGWSPTVTESSAKVWGPGQAGLGQRWSPEMTRAHGTARQDCHQHSYSGPLTNFCDLGHPK